MPRQYVLHSFRSPRALRQRAVSLVFAYAALGVSASLTACGGDAKGPTTVTLPTVTRVDVTAPSTAITTQQTVQLAAASRLSDGTSNNAPAVSWSSSATNVATVSASGLVTGVAAGTSVITATLGPLSGSATITVSLAPGALASVTVTLTDVMLQLAQNTQATVTGKDGTGAVLAIGARPVTWSSSNTVIATVSPTGVVVGVGIGTANIQVTVTEGATPRTATVAVAVTGIPNAPATADVSMPGLTFSPFQTLVKVGGTVRFIFPSLIHNVMWDARLSGQPAAPANINNSASMTVPLTFPTVGVYTYKCSLHNGMEGTVIVSP